MKLHWSWSFVREIPIIKGGLARDIHPTSHRYPYKRNVMLCQQMKRTVQVCGLRKAITIYERERAVCCPEKGNKSKPWPICLWRGNNSEILINFLCLHMFPFGECSYLYHRLLLKLSSILMRGLKTVMLFQCQSITDNWPLVN